MNNIEEVKQEVDHTISLISQALVDKITRSDFKTNSKIPYKVVSVKEIYKQKLFDCMEALRILIDNEKYLPALMIIRSIMEITSVINSLENRLQNALADREIKSLDEELMILLAGIKSPHAMGEDDTEMESSDDVKYQSKNILGYIDKMAKTYKSYRIVYEELSEFVHPNFCGCANTYSEIDEPSYTTYFGFNPDKDINYYKGSIKYTSILANIFLEKTKSIETMMPKLVELCNDIIKNNAR